MTYRTKCSRCRRLLIVPSWKYCNYKDCKVLALRRERDRAWEREYKKKKGEHIKQKRKEWAAKNKAKIALVDKRFRQRHYDEVRAREIIRNNKRYAKKS